MFVGMREDTVRNYGMGVRYVFPGLIPYFCHDDLKHEIDNYLHKLSLSVQLIQYKLL